MSILESALLGSTQFLDKTEEIKLIFLPPGNKWKLSLTGYAGGGSPLLLCISINNASSSFSTSVVILERCTPIL